MTTPRRRGGRCDRDRDSVSGCAGAGSLAPLNSPPKPPPWLWYCATGTNVKNVSNTKTPAAHCDGRHPLPWASGCSSPGPWPGLDTGIFQTGAL